MAPVNLLRNPKTLFKTKMLPLCLALAFPALAQAQANPNEAQTLAPVDVRAEYLGETTEGTHSYTTGKTQTATQLSTSPRETPQSVDVVTQQRITDQKLLTITDALNNTTGVYVQQYETNRAQFVSRGFEINTLMIDGVPTTWNQAWSSGEVSTSLALYDRVEIVRGATGMVTGAGEPSAAVNLIRKRATSKELTGTLELGYGRWNEWRGMFDVSTPLNEAKTVRARVVGEYIDKQSWVDRLNNKNQSFYATVEADLTPRTLLSVGVAHQDDNSRGSMWGGLPAWYADDSSTQWNRSKTTAANWTRWNNAYDNYYLDLEHRFENDWKVKASYSYGDRKSDSYLLYLYGAPDRSTGLGMGAFPASYHVHTQQNDARLQVSGPLTLFGQKHELTFGYTYSDQKFSADQRQAQSGFGAVSNFNTWDGSFQEPVWGNSTYYGESSTQQEGFYGAAQISLLDPLRLTLGGRFTNYKRTGNDVYTTPYTSKITQQFTSFAGLTYDLTDNYSLYASYTDIFQPQPYRDADGKYIDPVLGKSYEGGIKAEFYEGKLNASAALFRIKQDNLAQATGQYLPGTLTQIYRATVGATSEGFELDMSGEVLPNWNMSAGFTHYHLTDASGQDINSIYPRDTLRFFTTYKLPGFLHNLTVGGGVNWQSNLYTWAYNSQYELQKISQGNFATVNLMARYQITKQVSAQLNIDNLFDRSYYNIFNAYNQITYGMPLNVRFSVKYQF